MNARELIQDARKRLAKRPADVRKAALLRISRVEWRIAPENSLATLEEGLALDGRITESRIGFQKLERRIAGIVAPERLHQLAAIPVRRWHDSFPTDMIRHGRVQELKKYVLETAGAEELPLDAVALLLGLAETDEDKRQLLRRGADAWLKQDTRYVMNFTELLRKFRSVLPEAEARTILLADVDRVLGEPDVGVAGRVQDVEFSSTHALELFMRFDLILALAPERAQELVKEHKELAAALKHYPKAMESIHEGSQAEAAAAAQSSDAGWQSYISSLRGSDRNPAPSVRQAPEANHYSKSLELAAAQYREDRYPRPLSAAKEFWPSGQKYKKSSANGVHSTAMKPSMVFR